ncbi:MAG: hypothetical protein IPG84_15500 [Betaproteobacteria bacterium]|nr:hypothetical protein [Betaproteobacteria bacterium]
MHEGFPAMQRAVASATRPRSRSPSGGGSAGGAALLGRAADAARTLNYTGTIAYQRAARRRDGAPDPRTTAARSSRSSTNSTARPGGDPQQRRGALHYYPDAKVWFVSSRARFRNAFLAVATQQQSSLARNATRSTKGRVSRVAGLEAQAWTFRNRRTACATA